MKKLEVCHTPALYNKKSINSDFITVVVDILRATTSMCVAFYFGVKEIIPVSTLEQAKVLQGKGMLLAAEEDGVKPGFADYGNSPLEFQDEKLKGQRLAFKTTNGTGAILQARDASEIYLGSFANLSILTGFTMNSDKDIVILCSGWKGGLSLEDSVFAGAYAERLLDSGNYEIEGDGTTAAFSLWNAYKNDLVATMKKAAHAKRLQKLGLDNSHDYTFTIDTTVALPAFKNDKLIDFLKIHI